mgnify:CR=1 FL=1
MIRGGLSLHREEMSSFSDKHELLFAIEEVSDSGLNLISLGIFTDKANACVDFP